MSELIVREAVEGDLEAVGRISVEAYVTAGQLEHRAGNGYSRVLADARARFDTAVILIAERDDVIVGTVTMCPSGSPFRELAMDDEAEFRFLAVSPTARGTGVAGQLIDACEDYARREGAERLVIGVRDTNTSAIEMYLGRGFTRIPERDWRPVPDVLLLSFQRTIQ